MWAAVAEFRDPTYVEQLGLTGRHLYAIPIGQKATVSNAETTCTARGLNLVTHSRRYPAPRDTLTTAWAGGCSSEAILSFSAEFCGACSYNASAPSATVGDRRKQKVAGDRCRNLAVWYNNRIAGNPDGVFSWDVRQRTDMKALCIEKNLLPENRVVLDSAYRRVHGMLHEDVPPGHEIRHSDVAQEKLAAKAGHRGAKKTNDALAEEYARRRAVEGVLLEREDGDEF
jgi:hypothetical protein